jgi:hypothetical protein
MIAHRQCCYVRAEAVGFSDKRIAADLELMHLVPTRRAHDRGRLAGDRHCHSAECDLDCAHRGGSLGAVGGSVVAYDHSASVESRVVLGGDHQDPVRVVNV